MTNEECNTALYQKMFLSFVYMGYCVSRGQRDWKEIVAVQIAGNEVF